MSDHNGYWIHHCEPPCGLGTFDYECPACNAEVSSCDLWWYYEDTRDFSFECKNCQAKLKTYWDKEDGEQYVVLDDEGVDK